jgi:Phosphatase
MSKARNRPPHLDSKVGRQELAPPPTLAEVLERSHVAGRAKTAGPSELRRMVERAATERPQPIPVEEAWASVQETFGATSERPGIDPNLTIAAAKRAVTRITEVAGAGAPIALATSRPASLVTLHLALARLARISGGDVISAPDSGPLRVDGRTARVVRWIDGVAVVTDGQDLCATRGTEAPQEWLFLMPRPALVVADGPYADVAIEAGIEVIAPAGLDHCSLVIGSRRGRSCLVVPMWTDRPPDAYRPLLESSLIAAISPNGTSSGASSPTMTSGPIGGSD